MSTPDLDEHMGASGMPQLVRRADWPERLAFFLHTRGLMPFAWGLNDCALFAADWVSDATGFDPAHDLRGAYKDDASALRVLKRHGGLLAIARARLPAYVHPIQAHRGDLVCVDVEDPLTGKVRQTLGIVAGNGWWAAPGEHAAVLRPMSEVLELAKTGQAHAFAVG